MKNLYQLFLGSVERFSNRVFLQMGGSQLTYREVFCKTRHKIQELQKKGLAPGHRLLYSGPNSPEYVTHLLATHALKGTFVPLSPSLPNTQYHQILDLVRPQFHHEVPYSFPPMGLETIPAFVLFTSGTTASPKGVVLTHENILTNLAMIQDRFPLETISEQDASYSFLPWYHSYGLVCELLFMMSRGGKLILPVSQDPKTFVPEIRRVHPSLLFTVPRFLEKIQQASQQKLWILPYYVQKRLLFGNRLRMLSVGGAVSSPQTIYYFRDHWDLPVLQGYGLTETSPMISLTSLQDFRKGHIDTCGTPLKGISVRLDPDDCLEVQGPNVSPGYLGENNVLVRPRAKFSNHWFSTGDRVDVTTTPGHLRFLFRKKGLWKMKNGKFLDPIHLEKCILSKMPSVEQAVLLQKENTILELVVFCRQTRYKDKDQFLQQVRQHLLDYGCSEYELPKNVYYLKHPLSVNDGTLSLKQEPVRHMVEKKIRGMVSF